MNIKKQKLFAIVLLLFSILLVFSVAGMQRESLYSDGGNYLHNNAELSENSDKDIFAIGNTGVITKDDVKQAVFFYELNGADSDTAYSQAILYCEEREALYQEAIRRGYDCTDQEVNAYLQELKSFLENMDNSADYYEVVSQFPSEEEYWEYEYHVYRKDLPILHMKEDLENIRILLSEDIFSKASPAALVML